jgi:hypothetical protein
VYLWHDTTFSSLPRFFIHPCITYLMVWLLGYQQPTKWQAELRDAGKV